MAELRRSLAGVDYTTSLRKATKGSVTTAKVQFDWQILATDFATIVLGVSLIQTLFDVLDPTRPGGFSGVGPIGSGAEASFFQAVLGIAFAAITVWYFWVHGHYLRRRSSWDRIGDLTFVFACLLGAEVAVRGLWQGSGLPLFSLALQWLVIAFLLLGLRVAVRRFLAGRGHWLKPAVVLGSGERALSLANSISEDRDLGLAVSHVLALDGTSDEKLAPGTVGVGGRDVRVIHSQDPLAELLLRFGGHVVLVAPSQGEFSRLNGLLTSISMLFPRVGVVMPSTELTAGGIQAQVLMLREVAVVWLGTGLACQGWRLTKRLFDLFASLLILVGTAPILIVASLAILWREGGPVFFVQERIGRDGRVFKMIKFRTMVRDAEAVLAAWQQDHPELWAEYQQGNFKLCDDPRVTSLGRLLRKTSIDELPQLLNVLKGDMSLVGPRPLLPREVTSYGTSIQLYHTARPGLSGLWQVSGRSGTRFADRVRLDVWYLRNWRFWYDIVILFKTVREVLNRKGAY